MLLLILADKHHVRRAEYIISKRDGSGCPPIATPGGLAAELAEAALGHRADALDGAAEHV